MMILCIKELCLTNGLNDYGFKRMKVYNLPRKHAQLLIEEGYAVEFGFMHELPLTVYLPDNLKQPIKKLVEVKYG